MPQVLVLMAAGFGLYSAYKWVAREAQRASAAADRAREDLRRTGQGGQGSGLKDLGELVWDEKTGAYRPKDES
jgi:hypothetical protein